MHLTVITGPMFAGKTTELIRRLKRHRLAGMDTLLFKPTVDNRYDETHAVTHDGIKMKSIVARSSKEILEITERFSDVKVIGIEEAQFFDNGIVEVVRTLLARDYTIYIAGLDMDFMGRPFGPMPELLAIADDVYKLKAVCAVCGADATHTFKKKRDSLVIEVGGADIYEPRCRKCWYEGRKNQEGQGSLGEA